MMIAVVFAALVSIAPSVYALTVNTPASVVECQPTLFSWSGGQEPYYLTLVPGGQSMAAPIKSFPTQTGTSYTWLADLQANTIFNIALKDSTGSTAYSDIITIQAGSDITCLNTAVTEGGSASAGTVTTATGSASAVATALTSSGSKASGTSSATSSSSTSKSSGAASSLSVSSAMGVAGVMGLVGAALF